MQEAETLGDRICIFDEGKIKALGNLSQLRKKYGAGYSLVVEPIDNNVDEMG